MKRVEEKFEGIMQVLDMRGFRNQTKPELLTVHQFSSRCGHHNLSFSNFKGCLAQRSPIFLELRPQIKEAKKNTRYTMVSSGRCKIILYKQEDSVEMRHS